MNSEERTDHLYKSAKMKGLEQPTDSMISEAIHDAEQDVEQDILQALQAGGFTQALKYLDDRRDYIETAAQEGQYYASLEQP